jgi:hypothetical protein
MKVIKSAGYKAAIAKHSAKDRPLKVDRGCSAGICSVKR